MDDQLARRRALVLGGSSGLGYAVAVDLASAGTRVIVTSRDTERARQAAASLPGEGHGSVAVDLSAPAHDSNGLVPFSEAVSSGPPFGILVLNSGGPPPSRAIDLDADSVAEALRPLLLSQISVVRAILPQMSAAGWGRIVAVGSSGIQQPIPSLALSNVARSALASYLKSLAADLADKGITVNVVLPGRIATGRVASLDASRAEDTNTSVEEVRAASEGRIPAGRYGEPSEFAAAVKFLCSEEASYITGIQLRVDGGMVSSF